jgi:transposase
VFDRVRAVAGEGVSAGDVGALDHAALVALVVELRAELAGARAELAEARAELAGASEANGALGAANEKLSAEVGRLRAEAAKSSQNSSKPSSRDTAAERKRQAEERRRRAEAKAGSGKRKKGKQRGGRGFGPKLSEDPTVIIDHRPEQCSGCGAALEGDGELRARRQVIDVPEAKPVVTEHRSLACVCGCGTTTVGEFPVGVRAPVSYTARVRATVVYLLARQHIPVARVQETMRDLYGLEVSPGAINNFYSDAARRLAPFIAALVALLKALPVLHADETTDRVGTDTCWMHVLSTRTYTLIHASMTRGYDAVVEMGVLVGYTGVVIHDRLALYWKFKRAKHGICGAHLLRDLEEVAVVASQQEWAAGLAALLCEINTAADQARLDGHRRLAPCLVRGFSARYDTLVAQGVAANPEPPKNRKRDYYERKSYNLVTAFATHKKPILRFMNDLDTPMTNNQAERDLRPQKLHRKISGCFRTLAGAKRHADVRSYLSTTRKNDIPAITALTDLFNDTPWMPPTTHLTN